MLVSKKYLCALSLALTLTSASGAAFAAEPSPEDRATARALAAEGHRALRRGEHAAAADRFRRADALVHAPTLLVDLARSLVGLGRLVEAHEIYEQVLREGVDEDAAASWKAAYDSAVTEQQALSKRLAWVVVSVRGHDAPNVTVDGRHFPAAALGVKRAFDPGERRLVARAQGYLPSEQVVELKEGEARSVTLELERDPASLFEHRRLPASAAAERDPLQPRPDYRLAYAAFGLAGAGFVTAAVSGGLMLGKRSDLEEACRGSKCPPSARDDVSSYHRYGTISAIAAGVGVAGAITGVSLLMLTPIRKEPRRDRAHIVPVLKPGFVGVKGKF